MWVGGRGFCLHRWEVGGGSPAFLRRDCPLLPQHLGPRSFLVSSIPSSVPSDSLSPSSGKRAQLPQPPVSSLPPLLQAQSPSPRRNLGFPSGRRREPETTHLAPTSVLCVPKSKSEVVQSCLTVSDPMDCNPPGSSIHGILEARVLEWVAISFSRRSSQPGIEPGSPALQADARGAFNGPHAASLSSRDTEPLSLLPGAALRLLPLPLL